MSADVMSYALAVGAFLVMLLRLRRVRDAADATAVWFSVLLMGAFATTFAVFAPRSQAWVNQFVGDLFKLVGNCATLVAMFAASAMVLRTMYPAPHARVAMWRRAVLLIMALALMISMFVSPHPVELTGSFDGLYAIDPTLVVYTAAYASYFGGTTADLAVQFYRFARRSRGAMRAGLYVMCAAALVAVLHNAATLVVVARNVVTGSRASAGDNEGVCHSAVSDLSCFVAIGSPALAAGLSIAGFGVSYFASPLDGARRQLEHRRGGRRLERLHHALMQAFPEVATRTGTRSRGRLPVADQVVEIRDALLLLAPYRQEGVAATARAEAAEAGLTGCEYEAVAEAAEIRAALEAYRCQCSGRDMSAVTPAGPMGALTGFDEELCWLVAVSEAFDSPMVSVGRGV